MLGIPDAEPLCSEVESITSGAGGTVAMISPDCRGAGRRAGWEWRLEALANDPHVLAEGQAQFGCDASKELPVMAAPRFQVAVALALSEREVRVHIPKWRSSRLERANNRSWPVFIIHNHRDVATPQFLHYIPVVYQRE